jgi:hypothetical protein
MAIKRVPWFRKLKKTDPEPPLRLPIAAGAVSNGEGWWPDSARKRLIRKLVLEKAEEISRKEGIDRREFLMSSCGMATTLYMMNVVNGCSGGKMKDNAIVPMGGGDSGNSGGGSGTSGGGSGSMSSGGGGSGVGSGNAGNGAGGTMGGGSGSGAGAGQGGFAGVGSDAMVDLGAADMCLGNNDNVMVIDMQSHFASPETNLFGAIGLETFIGQITLERFPWIERTAGCTGPACLDRNEFIKQFFMVESPTTIGVLSGISYQVGPGGTGVQGFAALSNEDLIDGVRWIEGMFPGRMLSHCMVMPNDRITEQLAMMEANAGTYSNWKTYPPWTPVAGGGYWMNEGVGPQMVQKGLDLGSPIFCVHKGFPLNSFTPTYCDPKDIPPAAKMFPDAIFVIYHSAFENGLGAGQSTAPDPTMPMADMGWGPGVGQWPEGPYDEMDAAVQEKYPLNRGVNSLIKAMRDNNIGPNGMPLDGSAGPAANIYAECGGVWPNLMLQRPIEAAHYWGKLLKHMGEDRIVWGTDCLWFGSPQPLIQAFKAFEIPQDLIDKHGYPQLTAQAKQKILGLNARRVQMARAGVNLAGCLHSDYETTAMRTIRKEFLAEVGPRPDMIIDVPGPKTWREFVALRNHEHKEKLQWSGRMQPRWGRSELFKRG